MKTLLKVFVFSISFAVLSLSYLQSCKKTPFENSQALNHNQIGEPIDQQTFLVDSNQLVNFQYIQEVQQGVTDTSHTSLSASINTAYDVANKLDEVAYKASLKAIQLNQDAKELEKLHCQYQNDIAKYKKLNTSVRLLIKQKEYQLAKLKEKNESTRYFANLE